MSRQEILERLRGCLVNLDIEGVKKACEDAIAAGIPALEAVTEGMAKGMGIVGQKYENNEYFLAELVMAGETMKEGMNILEPHLKAGEMTTLGKVVIGTVKDDIHDIGKNIVIILLKSAGFEVVDLGVDVPSEKFVETIKQERPNILAMSALLTTTMLEMETTIKALKKAGLRSKVKVIIGGAPITPEYAKKIGADASARDAMEGVKICKAWS